MNLRIISGALRGRRISIPDRRVTFRATKDRVRQSLAETIKEKIPGARAADLCAGSGALGIEMVSRGAAQADFVERDRVLARSIAATAAAFGIEEKCRVYEQDIVSFIKHCPLSYDIIFYDPPYEDDSLAALAVALVALLRKGGVLLYEYSSHRKDSTPLFAGLEPDKATVETKAYGDTAVDIVRLR
jgi:16S rRNA (guanine966-N2)-methyltransferase